METRITFDPSVDAAYIYLKQSIGPGESKHQCEIDCDALVGSIIVDLDGEGRLLGIEILRARNVLPPEVLKAAVKP